MTKRALEITTVVGCTNACIYCPQALLVKRNRKHGGSRVMDFDMFRACIDKVPSDVVISFSGYGEPWQAPDCTKMVVYAYEKGHTIDLFTTLFGMTANDIDILKELSFRQIYIHLPDADGLMKVKVDDAYLAVLRKFYNTKWNAESCTYHVNGWQHPACREVIGDHTQLNYFSRSGNVPETVRKKPERLSGLVLCTRSRLTQNVLMPNGDVILCCMDYGLQHVLGNILEDSYETLCNSPEFRRVIEGLGDDNIDILCRHCEWAGTVQDGKLVDRDGKEWGVVQIQGSDKASVA